MRRWPCCRAGPVVESLRQWLATWLPCCAVLLFVLMGIACERAYAAGISSCTVDTASGKELVSCSTSDDELYFYGDGLTAVRSGAFDRLSSLIGLYLSSNKLTSLPSGIFDSLTSLTGLYLSSNKLTSLPSGIFDSLTSLRELSLSSNKLTSLPSGIFDSLTSLRELSLSSNKLTSLPSGIFDSLTSLTWLSLSSNQLTSLPSGIFDSLTSLEGLYLHYNQLTSLPSGIFDGLTSLTRLDLDGNQLTSLPSGIFDGLTSLTRLYLDGNQLTSLPFALSIPASVTSMSLHNNPGASQPCPASSSWSVLQARPFNFCLTVDCADKQCKYCEAGSYASASGTACLDCAPGHFSHTRGAISASVCKSCAAATVPGASSCTCPAGTHSVLELDPYTNPCTPCPTQGTCMANNTCAAGYGGTMCGECAPNYFRILNECQACEDMPWIIKLIGGLLFGVVIATGMKLMAAPGAVATLRELVAAFQLLAISINVNLLFMPTFIARLMDWLGSAWETLGLYSLQCDFDISWYSTLAGMGATVLLVVAGMLVVAAVLKRFALSSAKAAGFKSGAGEGWLVHRRTVLRLLVTLLLLARIPVTRKLLDALVCVSVSGGGQRLLADMAVDCTSPGHRALQVLCGITVVLLIVVIPTWLGWRLWKLHKAGELHISAFGGYMRTWYFPYKNTMPYAESLRAVYEGLVLTLAMGMTQHGVAQSILLLVLTCSYTAFVIRVRPLARSRRRLLCCRLHDALNTFAIIAAGSQSAVLVLGLVARLLQPDSVGAATVGAAGTAASIVGAAAAGLLLLMALQLMLKTQGWPSWCPACCCCRRRHRSGAAYNADDADNDAQEELHEQPECLDDGDHRDDVEWAAGTAGAGSGSGVDGQAEAWVPPEKMSDKSLAGLAKLEHACHEALQRQEVVAATAFFTAWHSDLQGVVDVKRQMLAIMEDAVTSGLVAVSAAWRRKHLTRQRRTVGKLEAKLHSVEDASAIEELQQAVNKRQAVHTVAAAEVAAWVQQQPAEVAGHVRHFVEDQQEHAALLETCLAKLTANLNVRQAIEMQVQLDRFKAQFRAGATADVSYSAALAVHYAEAFEQQYSAMRLSMAQALLDEDASVSDEAADSLVRWLRMQEETTQAVCDELKQITGHAAELHHWQALQPQINDYLTAWLGNDAELADAAGEEKVGEVEERGDRKGGAANVVQVAAQCLQALDDNNLAELASVLASSSWQADVQRVARMETDAREGRAVACPAWRARLRQLRHNVAAMRAPAALVDEFNELTAAHREGTSPAAVRTLVRAASASPESPSSVLALTTLVEQHQAFAKQLEQLCRRLLQQHLLQLAADIVQEWRRANEQQLFTTEQLEAEYWQPLAAALQAKQLELAQDLKSLDDAVFEAANASVRTWLQQHAAFLRRLQSKLAELDAGAGAVAAWQAMQAKLEEVQQEWADED